MSIDSLEESECWLLMDEDSKTRKDAFEKCAWCSWKVGAYPVFGLDSNNSCYSGIRLRFTCVVQNFRVRKHNNLIAAVHIFNQTKFATLSRWTCKLVSCWTTRLSHKTKKIVSLFLKWSKILAMIDQRSTCTDEPWQTPASDSIMRLGCDLWSRVGCTLQQEVKRSV